MKTDKGQISRWIIVLIIGLMAILALRDRDYFHYYVESSGNTDEYRESDRDSFKGAMAFVGPFELKKGTYDITITYKNKGESNYFEIVDTEYSDGIQVYEKSLDKFVYETGDAQTTYRFELAKDVKKMVIRSTQVNGRLKITDYNLTSVTAYYNDTYFLVIIWILLLGAAWYKKKWFVSETGKQVLIICGIAILVSVPLFTDFLSTGHDIAYHLFRIKGISEALLNGQIPVRVNTALNNGYGLINPIMYPEMWLYIPGILCAAGVSLLLSVKFFLILVNISTGLISYYSFKTLCDKKCAMFFSIMYLMAPYRLDNLYIRFAIGEFLAMTFLPMLFVGMYQIVIGNPKRWWMAALGCTGILQSHLLSTEVSVLFTIIFLLLNLKTLLKEPGRILHGLKAVIGVLILNAWYLIPLCTFINSKFILTDDSRYLGENGIYFSQMISAYFSANGDKVIGTTFQDMSAGLGMVYLVGMIVLMIYSADINRENVEKKTFLFQNIVMGIIAVYMASWLFPWEVIYKNEVLGRIFGIIQFSWRFLAFATLFLSLGMSIVWKWTYTNKKVLFYGMTICMLICLGKIIDGYTYDVPALMENKYSQLYENGEYNYFYKVGYNTNVFGKRSSIVSIEGADDFEVTNYNKSGTTLNFDYSVSDVINENTLILPYYNYGFYKVFVNGQEMKTFSNDDELLSITIPQDTLTGHVTVRYAERKIYLLGDIVSVLALISCMIVLIKNNSWKKEERP